MYRELYCPDLALGWGDNERFDVIDFQTQVMDDNGIYVSAGIARHPLPLGWIKNDK